MSVTVRVPAKLNIALQVGPARNDGFHELQTIYHAVSLYDGITVAEGAPGSGISIVCTHEDVPLDARNLAWQAAELIAARAQRDPDLKIRIDKGIPVSGGMAGGSADAAGTLIAVNALWELNYSREELQEMAAELGSDVPFCIAGGTQLGQGRGELLSPVLAKGSFDWVIATSQAGLSTPAVYAKLDEIRPEAEAPRIPEEVVAALRTNDAKALGLVLHNDLQAPAIVLKPSLQRTLEAGIEAGALGALVSGSGPTVVFLVRDAEHALDVQIALTGSGFVHEVLTASGPVRPAII